MNTPLFALPGLRVLLADAGQRRSPVIRLELIRLRCQLVDVIDLVVGGWRAHSRLVSAANRTLATAGSEDAES